ncbi:MAG: Uma2 family endonuclease [Leptolyngbya sp. SIO4C1]|nr:Uma2 family endonuclease [Leptolyngbya sp. SIO4C1]
MTDTSANQPLSGELSHNELAATVASEPVPEAEDATHDAAHSESPLESPLESDQAENPTDEANETAADAAPPRYTVADYRSYEDGSGQRYELVDGHLEALVSPSFKEVLIAQFLKKEFDQQIEQLAQPWQCFADAGLRTGWRKVRLPDVYIIHAQQVAEDLVANSMICQTAPALVVEVVKPASANVTYRHKRSEYAALGILEYWIVDPLQAYVAVLSLNDGLYEDTVFQAEDIVVSQLFPSLTLDAESILVAGGLA